MRKFALCTSKVIFWTEKATQQPTKILNSAISFSNQSWSCQHIRLLFLSGIVPCQNWNAEDFTPGLARLKYQRQLWGGFTRSTGQMVSYYIQDRCGVYFQYISFIGDLIFLRELLVYFWEANKWNFTKLQAATSLHTSKFSPWQDFLAKFYWLLCGWGN